MSSYILIKHFHLIIIVLTGVLLSNAENCIAQEKGEDVSDFFDDGGVQNGKSILKIDFISVINGDLQLLLEHRFKKSFAFEVGLGIVSNKGIRGIFPEFSIGIPSHDQSYNKLSYSLGVKYYTHGKPEHLFFSINHRRRPYLGANVVDFYLGSGYQYILKKRMILALGIGYGLRMIQKNNEPMHGSNRYNASSFFPLQLSIGYIL